MWPKQTESNTDAVVHGSMMPGGCDIVKYIACDREAAPHVRLSVMYLGFYTCLHHACALPCCIIH